MSLQRTRPVDGLQRIMTSFKHFEKKLDKLQTDVDYHGQTLNDLRGMVNTLSINTVFNPDAKSDEMKRPSKKNTAIQYENRTRGEKPYFIKRKNAIQPLPSKIKAKSLQAQKTTNESSFFTMPANTQGIPRKRSPRPRKAEVPRKANKLRTHYEIKRE